MKKLIYLLLVIALLGSLWACGPSEVPGDISAPTETETPSAPPTESEVSTDDIVEHEYLVIKHLLSNKLYRESDGGSLGVLTVTNLATGEKFDGICSQGFVLWCDTDELDWDNALTESGDLFADANYVVRLTNPETDWYAEFHDGTDAGYIYLSEEGLYVPVKTGRSAYEGAPIEDLDFPRDRTAEDVAQDIRDGISLLWEETVIADPGFRVENTAIEAVVEQHAQRRAAAWTKAVGETVTLEDFHVGEISEDGTRVTFSYTLTSVNRMWLAANAMPNGDGTYSFTMHEDLILDENGFWIRELAVDYINYG